MPLPIPGGKNIQVIHKVKPADYEMPLMEVASDHYEICLMVHGDRGVITPTMTYSLHTGSVHAVGPYVYHRTVPASGEDYETILIKFTPNFVKPFCYHVGQQVLDKIFEFPLKTFSEQYQELVFNIARVMVGMANDNSYSESYKEFRLQVGLYEMLLILYENAECSTEANVHNSELSQPIMEAVYYMERNYARPIKIDEVARASGYSVSYFSRLFQSQLGSSFSEYLSNIRLKHVQDALLTTDKSITDISMECGFTYPGNMTSCFRQKFGMTPQQFRKQRFPL